MKKTLYRGLSIILIFSIVLIFSGCSIFSSSSKTSSSGGHSSENSGTNKTAKLQVLSLPSNSSGNVTGWYGNILKKKLGISLQLLPAGTQGEQKLQAMMASGQLPDIVVFKSQKQVYDAARANLLVNLDDHMKQLPNVAKYAKTGLQYYRQSASGGTGKAYAVPSNIGPGEVASELNWGPYLRWDLYKKLGMPKLNKLEDYLPLLKKMQQMDPKNSDGQKVYAFSFWKDWDSYTMQQATTLADAFGFDTGDQLGASCPFLQVNLTTGETSSILDPNSWYIRVLKFYNKAYQMGLVDPDSLTQNFNTASDKMKQGRILFSWWPWFGDNFNTIQRTNANPPIGFRPVFTNESKLLWWGNNPIGSSWAFGIGASTKNLNADLKFLNFMYSPAAGQLLYNGPQGLTWDMNSKGQPYITKKGWDIINNNKDLPGGGKLADAAAALNTFGLSGATINPKTNAPINYQYWSSTKTHNPTNLMKDWQKTTGYKTTADMVKAKKMYVTSTPAISLVAPLSDDMSSLATQIGNVVTNDSWLAVFSKNDQEFNQYINDMRTKANQLGIAKLIKDDEARWNKAQQLSNKYTK